MPKTKRSIRNAAHKSVRRKPQTSTAIVPAQQALSIPEAIEKVLIVGDLSALSPTDRELSLYANKSCTEQLRKIHGVSVIPPLRRSWDGNIITVEVDVRDRTGKTDTASGSVPTFKFKDGTRIDFTGKDRCNADMKCETKAKRRATLSICGLAFLDESELDTMQVLGGVTPDGRIFRYAEEENGHEAAQRVLSAKLASGNPNPLEPETAPPERPASQEPVSSAVPKAQIPPREWRGAVEIDWSVDSAFPRITGDIAEVAAHFPADLVLKRKDDFWHAFKEDVPRIKAACEKEGFRVNEIHPKSSAVRPTAQSEKPRPGIGSGGKQPESGAAAPVVVAGIIEQVFTPQNAASPMRQVKILLADKKKPTFGCFIHPLFEYLDKAKGAIEAYVTTTTKGDRTFHNIVGLKSILTTKGLVQFDDDGRTPVIQKDREAGGRTLFGQ